MQAISLRLSTSLTRPTSFARTSQQLQHAIQRRDTVSLLKRNNNLSKHTCLQNNGYISTQSFHPPPLQQTRQATTPYPIPPPTNNPPPPPLPPYTPPKTGLLSHLPAPWIPYAELIRLDKPTGTTYLFLPCAFSTLLAAPLTHPITPPGTILSTLALFYAGALIMRGAGCTINDLWDRNLDPRVARTRLRPIARGAVTVKQGIVFLGGQLVAGLGVLVCFPAQCLWYATPSLLLVGTYPLAKRVTNYPQFVLGLTFSWGAIMGFPALGLDLLHPDNTSVMLSAGCLYASCVAWTVVYDMIYAYQDVRDDLSAGIKSIALAQQQNAKVFLAAVAGVQVVLLGCAGSAVGAGPVFYGGACGGAAATLGVMIRRVDLGSVGNCWRWFRKGAWFTGGAIGVGLGGEYGMRYLGLYGEHEGDERRKIEAA